MTNVTQRKAASNKAASRRIKERQFTHPSRSAAPRQRATKDNSRGKNQPDDVQARGAENVRTKRSDQLVAFISSPDGATIPEICQNFGWLDHSARAALTGLRKLGHNVFRTRADGVSRYGIA